MIFLFCKISLLFFILSASSSATQNDTESHKTIKRTASDQIYSQGDAKPVVVYLDSISSQSSNSPEYALKNFYSNSNKPLALVSVQQPIQVFEQDNPKQVAAQQVSYEFQKTPTNAVSNVHVQQLFQPDDYDDNQSNPPLPQHPQAPGYVATAETVVSPVHHNTFPNHAASPSQNQPTHFNHQQTQFNNPPSQFNNQHTQLFNNQPNQFNNQPHQFINQPNPFSNQPNQFNQQTNQFNNNQPNHFGLSPNVVYHNQRNGPGKYLYLNGRIVYQPNPSQNHGNLQSHSTRVHPVNLVNYNSFGHGPAPHQGVNLNSNNPALIHNQQKVPLVNFANRHLSQPAANVGVRPKMFPPPSNPPITFNRYHQVPQHQKHQMERITQPSPPPPGHHSEDQNDEINEENDDEEENAASENEEDEEEAAEDADNEEDQDRPTYDFHKEDDHGPDDDAKGFSYEKYHYDDDHYSGRHKRRQKSNNRDDEGEERGKRKRSSKSTKPSKSKKHHGSKKDTSSSKYHPDHYDEDTGYKFSEGYAAHSKYGKTPSSKHSTSSHKNRKKPKGQYFKKVKYQKRNSKPKIETIEGRYSEMVPVTHKHKFYKEKWFVTKSTDGAANVDTSV